MRTIGLAIVFFAGCSSSSSGSPPSLYGNWIQDGASGNTGQALTLRNDKTYTFSDIVVTSSKTANSEVEKGHFVDNGDSLTFTPEQWSCQQPDPPTTVKYTLGEGTLALANPQRIVSYKANTEPTATDVNITIGCFDQHGAFTPSPLAPVH